LIAHHADRNGEWIIDQPTLQRWSRLTERRFRQVLTDLVTDGELTIVSHHGRGKRTTYRLLREPENRLPAATTSETEAAHSQFSSSTPAAHSQFSSNTPAAHSQFSGSTPAARSQFSPTNPAAHSQFSAPLDPPFPPDPQIPLYPPEKADMESFALAPRPLSGPQSATFRTNLLLEEAGVPLPSPAQIGVWVRTLGGVEPLLDLLRQLISAGLATKKTPAAYIHRVVMERAERTEPARPLDARAGREMLRAAGADEARWIQAQEIMANVEKI
ncbi:MAG TPA: hypothetical protein VL025_10110, partial [Thermoanaerobaculia bacterium]|nr:hypothetical protein [Thermoanaerobaculia bacterium]